MRAVALVFCLLLWPAFGLAQGAATLVADQVRLNDENQLIASGNVEVIYEGTSLTASQITYDPENDSLQVTGPIFLRGADGTILTAATATLDARLENGLLQSARIVFDQQLQLAANQIDQRQGRFSQLYKTAATSCNVCGNRPPLWEIRAERVVYDRLEQQIYFRNATFHVRDVPVFWLPRFRLPDPSLARATGLLTPEQRNTTQLGTGIKLPYFITLGDHRDLTVTPYIAPETRTLELRYRQAFVNGRIELNGAVSDDSLREGNRSYFFAEGRFDLADEYQLAFDIETTSDEAYLFDYGYADKDRLDSAISLTRVDDRSLYQARLTYYETLRDDEANASLPPIIADLQYQVTAEPAFGGTLRLMGSFDIAYRTSDANGDAGRDVARAGAAIGWRDDWISPQGIVAALDLAARADLYTINDDTAFADEDLRVVPETTVTLRWPLAQTDLAGTSHLLEPTVMIGWSDSFGGTPPNEDSTRSTLDRGNLFDVNRFAGDDAVAGGLQAAAGLSWTRIGQLGGTSTLAFGRVLRNDPVAEFSRSSGLDDTRSDWLLAGQIAAPGGFLFDVHSLWDEDIGLNVADSRLQWQNARVALGANYVWQSKDADENRSSTLSEWSFDAEIVLSDAWTLALDGRYNVIDDSPVRGGIGLQWQNECVTIDVSASRRYTSSSTVDPTTTFGLSGSIGSFATGRQGPACRNE